MSIESKNINFTVKEQVDFLINLTHDEFLESVIMGSEEEYQEWAEFCAECIAKVLIPTQPDGRQS